MGQTVCGEQISQDTAGFYKLYSQKGYNSLNGHRLVRAASYSAHNALQVIYFYCINISISVVFNSIP